MIWWGCGGGFAAPAPPPLVRSGGAEVPSRPHQKQYSGSRHGSVNSNIDLHQRLRDHNANHRLFCYAETEREGVLIHNDVSGTVGFRCLTVAKVKQ